MRKIGDKLLILSPMTRFQIQNPFQKPSDSNHQEPEPTLDNLHEIIRICEIFICTTFLNPCVPSDLCQRQYIIFLNKYKCNAIVQYTNTLRNCSPYDNLHKNHHPKSYKNKPLMTLSYLSPL